MIVFFTHVCHFAEAKGMMQLMLAAGRTDIPKEVRKVGSEFNPQFGVTFVVVSNIYAAVGRRQCGMK